jgi:hypothetical protein
MAKRTRSLRPSFETRPSGAPQDDGVGVAYARCAGYNLSVFAGAFLI